MRILVTGSSGQIGTNLALRLQRDGHSVFGVDKRPEPWVGDAFPTLLQDLAGHYSSFPGGINGVEYPEVDLVVHLAAHAKVHQLVRQPHRALENAIMTFNVLEYARGIDKPIVFSSSREVYGDVHRFEEYAGDGRRLRLHRVDVLGVENRRRGVRLLVRPLLWPRAISSSASRMSMAASTTTCTAWCAFCRCGSTSSRATSRSPSTARTRRSTSPTSTTASTASCAAFRRLPNGRVCERHDQPRLRQGQPSCCTPRR